MGCHGYGCHLGLLALTANPSWSLTFHTSARPVAVREVVVVSAREIRTQRVGTLYPFWIVTVHAEPDDRVNLDVRPSALHDCYIGELGSQTC